jgi:hypothetical protein
MPTYYYLNIPRFPADAPAGYPHILDEVTDDDNYLPRVAPELVDFITTVLYRMVDHSTAVDEFHDSSVNSFRMAGRSYARGIAWMGSYVIQRIGEHVVVRPGICCAHREHADTGFSAGSITKRPQNAVCRFTWSV